MFTGESVGPFVFRVNFKFNLSNRQFEYLIELILLLLYNTIHTSLTDTQTLSTSFSPLLLPNSEVTFSSKSSFISWNASEI